MRFKLLILISIFALTFSVPAQGITKINLSKEEIDRIIRAFTEKEKEFREALKNYVFNRSVTIQTIGLGGNVTGTYRRDSFMTFTDDGRRFERIIYFPVSTLKEISVTPEDLEDLGGVNPFALEPDVIHLYNFTLVGKEKIDELDLYVFDVTPKVIPDPKKSKQRLFTGRIWVDDRDLQIVKSKGKGIPETKNNKFPIVETWRENIDGKYWFPAFSSSDDELVFDNGQVVRIRMRVKYYNYKRTRTDVRILDDDTDKSR
ncbi:MAG: hypothetical protein N2Z23_03850 [Pyrinomonadaceae bacterium]|nr:hypothetical protein [Pyrinomonadaceae bacterium]MCX7639561.1 hypothetical protein [Pyrinomonadaceae bacterium]MDW8303954.1 hypothetical protein [Acidobacteriota bacterium]